MKLSSLSLKISVLTASLFMVESAYSTNGYLVTGHGYKVGTAGAGVAKGTDATDAWTNPSLLTRSPSNIFIAAGVFHPKRFKDTSNTPLVPIAPGFSANYANPIQGKQWSRKNNYFDGSFGAALNMRSFSIGLALTGSGGMSTDFSSPRINPLLLNQQHFDSGVLYRILNITPAIAFPLFSNRVSFGMSPVFSYSDFKTDIAVPGPNGAPVQNAGRYHTDRAWGVGFKAGADWKITQSLTFALCGQSPTRYERFEKYRDVLSSTFNYPGNITTGFAWNVAKAWTLLLDHQYIHFTGTKLLKRTPINGGFGWGNMHVFKFGVIHDWNEALTLRAGYNYGKSPIAANRVFANVISLAVVEHHFGAGITYKIAKKHALSLSGFYVPMKKMTESGSGDSYSQAGRGTQIGMRQYGVQASYQFIF